MNIRIEIQYELICHLGYNEIEAQRKVHSWSIIFLKEKKNVWRKYETAAIRDGVKA